MEHGRSIHPSAILVSSLLLTLFFDAVRLRTLWAIQDNGRVRSAFAVAMGFKAMVFVVESWPKVSHLMPRSTKPPPEATSGVFGKVFFTWILPLFKSGYKGTLYVENMWPIDSDLQSNTNFSRLRDEWLHGKSYAEVENAVTSANNFHTVNQQQPHSLLKIFGDTYKWHIFAAIPPRLVFSALTYTQPFLISRMVDYVSSPASPLDRQIGFGMVGAYGLVYLGIAVGESHPRPEEHAF